MSLALNDAELQLAAAYAHLGRVKGTEQEGAARERLAKAQAYVEAVKNAAQVVAQRQCCGVPMTWHGAGWICSWGHD